MQTRVKAWLRDAGVPVTHQTIQGALVAVTFVTNELMEGRKVDMGEIMTAFAKVGAEARVDETAQPLAG